MIGIFERDRLGAPRCPDGHTNPGVLAQFADGWGVSMRQRAPRNVQPVSRPAFIAAPKTYLITVVPTSVALHERRT